MEGLCGQHCKHFDGIYEIGDIEITFKKPDRKAGNKAVGDQPAADR